MLELVFGTSGSGKSSYLMQKIREDIESGRRCYLLVPDQQEFITEATYLSVNKPSDRRYFEVTSFSRLSDMLMEKYGGAALSLPDRSVETLLLWNVLHKLSGSLEEYRKEPDASLTSLMYQALNEFISSAVSPEAIDQFIGGLDQSSALKPKLKDLSSVYTFYVQDLKKVLEQHYLDPCAYLCYLLANHPFFEGTHVYIDSFTGFSSVQQNVISLILAQSERVTVTIGADKWASKLPHFYESIKTAADLVQKANEAGIPVEQTYMEKNVRRRTPSLQYLEGAIWDYTAKPAKDIPDDGSISLLECENIYVEAEATALKILELVNGGMHFGNIAVTVRDTLAYEGILDAAFEKYKIPYFMSKRTDLSSKPIARFLLLSLRCVLHNFRADDVVALSKTGLCDVTYDDSDLFASYCELWHISGSLFTRQTWTMNPEGLSVELSDRGREILSRVNRVREKILEPLVALSGQMDSCVYAKDYASALYDYLLRTGVHQRLSDYAEGEIQNDRIREAGDTIRTYDEVIRILTVLCRVLPDTELTLQKFSTALSLMMSQTDLGSVPDLFDCVTVGASGILRVEHVDAMFILGLCDGEFPNLTETPGLLTEADKVQLEKGHILLNSDKRTRQSRELFGLYRAVSKPSEKLYLSTQTHAPNGGTKLPSDAYLRVRSLLPNVIPQTVSGEDIPSLQYTARDTLSLEGPADPGKGLYLSQSRITSFVQCPYQHYAKYVMYLNPEHASGMDYAEAGTFIHEVMEYAMKKLYDGTTEKPLYDEAKLHELVSDKVHEKVSKLLSRQFIDFKRDNLLIHQYERLGAMAYMMLKSEMDSLSVSSFVPRAFEWQFSARGRSDFRPIPLTLKDGTPLFLTGKLDRVDYLRAGDRDYVRIVDYKTGASKEFKLKEVRSGEDIQLMLYLFTLCDEVNRAQRPLLPAGALYVKPGKDSETGIEHSGIILNEPMILGATDPTAQPLRSNAKKFEGQLLFTELQFKDLDQELREKILEIGEGIHAGRSEKHPDPNHCKNCVMAGRCAEAAI